MIDIKRMFVALKTDSVLQPLLGSTLSDPRIYWYYQPDAEISAAKRAYITYAQTAHPQETTITGDPIYTIAVWGIGMEVVEAIRDRLVDLWEKELLQTPTGRTLFGTLVGEHDSYQEHTKFAGKNLQFRFGFSRV